MKTIMTDLEIAYQQDIAPWDDRVTELSDYHVAVFRDRYPVTPGHLLFVPQYNNDPVGGVRGVIIGQANYKTGSYQKP